MTQEAVSEEYEGIVTRLKLVGMHCAACAVTIENKLKKLDGVIDASVSFAGEEAKIVLKPGKIRLEDVVRAIREVGYDVDRSEVILWVSGMSTYSDEKAIEDALYKLNGVFTVRASSAAGNVYVEYNKEETSDSDISKVIESLGYTVSKVESSIDTTVSDAAAAEERDLLYKSIVGAIFSIPIALLAYNVFNLKFLVGGEVAYRWISLLLASVVQFYTGSRFITGALKALKNKVLNMDVLVFLGTMAAYIFSAIGTVLMIFDYVYFEASALVLTFVVFGRYLEAKTKKKAGEALRKLLSLQPKTAKIITEKGEEEVPISAINVRDKVVVRPGERIPVDGVVLEGEGYVDESIITGEYKPVLKKKDDPVIAGTLLKNGSLVISATRVGKNTMLSQIATLVKLSQMSKPKIQRTIDKVVAWFVPIVISISLAAFIFWYLIAIVPFELALLFSISVLVIACPCALGIATPMAIMVGYGKAAEEGIIIRNGEAFERMSEIDTIVFDKTGTLTFGKPKVTNIVPNGKIEKEEIIKLAAIVETRSEHPLGEAIVEKAKELEVLPQEIELERFDYIPGQGVIGIVDGKIVAVGNEDLVEKGFGVKIEDNIREKAKELRKKGETVVYVIHNKELIGLISIADKPKPYTKEVIDYLHKMGIDTYVLSGDNEITVKSVAKELGIDEYKAGAKPNDKVNFIRELQKQGKKVMMIGDGVNDAASLSQSDVGVAMGSGTDIAAEAGDIILTRDDLRTIIVLFEISKKIKGKIKQNVLWAFIYNILLIPIAAGVLYPYMGLILRPEFAGLAMALSSISVSTNALLLKNWKSRIYEKITMG